METEEVRRQSGGHGRTVLVNGRRLKARPHSPWMLQLAAVAGEKVFKRCTDLYLSLIILETFVFPALQPLSN